MEIENKVITSWASNELSNVDLGDKRLDSRLIKLVDSMSAHPTQSIPANCSTWGETKAAYRFFDNGKATIAKILAPHHLATLDRIRSEKVALLLQDTTDIDFTGRQSISGIGYTGSTQETQKSMKGFFLHPTVAVTPQGLCLGTVDSQIWIRENPPVAKKDKKITPYDKKIEDKESKKWLNSYQQTKELAVLAADTIFVNIGDRECDVYEFFLERDESIPNAHFITRSLQDRKIANSENKLWEETLSKNSLGEIKFILPEGRGRKSRPVIQEIRSATIELQAPARKGHKLENITINAVVATEINTPEGEEPIEWLLLTSLSVATFEDAMKIIDYYLCRWQIEIYFKVIKSGCQIEKLQLETLDRISTCLAIYMIIAWRILFTTMIGRIAPDMPCNKVFSEAEWKGVFIVTYKKQPPDIPPNLNDMIKMVAQLGGFLNRKGDGDPGVKTMWIGMQRMRDFALSWEAHHELK
jgi:hypothetical protein